MTQRSIRPRSGRIRADDNLDIFIVPSINPDGAHYSLYDNQVQRRNMTYRCPGTFNDPAARNFWGVDLSLDIC